MTWVRLDDSMPEHPKIAALSHPAFRLHIEGLCYSARALTDGVIPTAIAPRLGSTKAAAELVAAGIWDESDAGFVVHDYLDYQPSREDVLSLREKRAEAGRRGGLRSKPPSKPEANASANGKQPRKPIGTPARTQDLTSAEADVVEHDARRGDVDHVWEEYTTRHPRARLTQPRRGLIRRRLKDYPVDVLIAAIRGNHLDAHCNGDNPRGASYHDLELILRDAAHIERYSGLVGPAEVEHPLDRARRWWSSSGRDEDDLRGVWGDDIADQLIAEGSAA